MSVHEDITKKLHGVEDSTVNANSASTSGDGYIDQIPGW